MKYIFSGLVSITAFFRLDIFGRRLGMAIYEETYSEFDERLKKYEAYLEEDMPRVAFVD